MQIDIEIQDPQYLADGRIDCRIRHASFGWIPFTADPNDTEPHGREIYAAALEIGPAPYIAPEPPTPTIADFTAAIDAHVEAAARARQYNSAAHLASYVASTVPAWAAEALAFVAWRDAVWLFALAELDAIQSGAKPVPTVADVIAALPDLA